MTWSPWIEHDFTGFPSHILKCGYLVEVELINCAGVTKGHAMFVVGQSSVNTDYGEDSYDTDPTDNNKWGQPSILDCLARNSCTWVVGRYKYQKPKEKKKTVEERETITA